jgi:glycerol kinase
MAKNTYGTGNFMLLNTGTEIVPVDNGLLTTVCYQLGDEPAVYALEGSIAVTGSLVQWVARQPRDDRDAPRSRPGAVRSTTTAGRTSCRPSPGSSPRTGAPMPAGRSSG